jgi:hypothetical protein
VNQLKELKILSALCTLVPENMTGLNQSENASIALDKSRLEDSVVPYSIGISKSRSRSRMQIYQLRGAICLELAVSFGRLAEDDEGRLIDRFDIALPLRTVYSS